MPSSHDAESAASGGYCRARQRTVHDPIRLKHMAKKQHNTSPDTRENLLRLAARSFGTQGYSATSMRSIAEQAGIEAASIYYHFSSKEELVEEVLRYGVQFTHTHVREAVDKLPDGTGPGKRLEAAVVAYLEAMLDLGDLAPAHFRTFNQIPSSMQ